MWWFDTAPGSATAGLAGAYQERKIDWTTMVHNGFEWSLSGGTPYISAVTTAVDTATSKMTQVIDAYGNQTHGGRGEAASDPGSGYVLIPGIF